MNWEIVGSTGEWAGALAVVVTLFYLARQIRLSNRIGSAEAEREWFDNWHEVVRGFGSDEHVAEIIQRGLNDYSALTQPEKGTFHVRLAGVLNQTEVARRMAEKDLLSKDLLETNVRTSLSLIKTVGGQAWWNDVGHTFAIYNYLEERRDDIEVAPFDELSSWQSS